MLSENRRLKDTIKDISDLLMYRSLSKDPDEIYRTILNWCNVIVKSDMLDQATSKYHTVEPDKTLSVERNFFKAYNIEPKLVDCCKLEDDYDRITSPTMTRDEYIKSICPCNRMCNADCPFSYQEEEFPEITDTMLLKLICTNNSYWHSTDDVIFPKKYINLKHDTLKKISRICDRIHIYNRVREIIGVEEE